MFCQDCETNPGQFYWLFNTRTCNWSRRRLCGHCVTDRQLSGHDVREMSEGPTDVDTRHQHIK